MARTTSFTNGHHSARSTRAGRWVTQGSGDSAYLAFIPKPLPPDPPLVVDTSMQDRLELASLALGRLDGIGRLLPRADDFLYSYVRKEAVLSSQIEGTQSSLTDLLVHENKGAPGITVSDAREVSNYVAALNHGLDLLRTRLPLSLRLIREIHGVLMEGTRGGQQAPGEFRRTQNWIGGKGPSDAYYVPPPAHEVMPTLGQLEKFLHGQPVRFPGLLKAGLVHAQFETIHPFLDGNGRIGRLLITLVMVAEGALADPWLYMSLYFKKMRQDYYTYLQRVRTDGDWEGWMSFFLEGVALVAQQAASTIQEIIAMIEHDRATIQGSRGTFSIYQKAALQANIEVFEYFRKKMLVKIPEVANECSISKPTAARVLSEFEQLGIAREITGNARNRMYIYQKYVDLLGKD
jgi:Fic family protein